MAAGRFQLLVVEDDPSYVEHLHRVLGDVHVDHDMTHLADGESALRFVQRHASERRSVPDLVLLDLNLPGASGIEVLRAIRGSESLRRVAVIVVSSSPMKPYRGALEELGAEMYWAKPADLRELYDLAESIKAIAIGCAAECIAS